MPGFSWNHAFHTFAISNEDEAVQRTVMKVIHTEPEKNAKMLERGWPRGVGGLQVSFLSRPCILHK